MRGALTVDGKITGNVSNHNVILAGRIENGLSVSGGITVPGTGYLIPIFDGPYIVTPMPDAEVVLETYGKRMSDNVTVEEIPYFETSNEAGGYTVIIG